jgi:hypothetical protein
MALATGVAKQVRFKKEATWGTAPTASGAQLLRRVTSDLSLTKEAYQSSEIRTDYQVADYRHGVRSVAGAINGELSPKTYSEFFAATLRKDFVAGESTGAGTSYAVAGTGTTFTDSSNGFVTDGFKVGDVISATGFTTANNNNHYCLVTGVAAGTLNIIPLDGVVLTDEAEGDTVTISVVGKKSYTPETAQTDDSFSIEHFHDDVDESELFTGCKVNSLNVALPPTGMATIGIDFMGKDITTAQAEYFTSPTATTNTGILASVNGVAYALGSQQTVLTGLTINIAGNMSSEPVVGSNTYPDIFEGRVVVTGELTAFFENGDLRDAFIDEDEVALMFVFTTSNEANPDFVSFVMPRVKLGSATKDDGEKGLVQTISYQALFNDNGTGEDKTTLIVQDSAA